MLQRLLDAPTMLALSWMDSRQVRFLSTGASSNQATANRHRGANVDPVQRHRIVHDYHEPMGASV